VQWLLWEVTLKLSELTLKLYMKLSLQKTHQSLTTLYADELPNFAIITGPNGSGKTHLLRGIENGSILVDGVAKNIDAQARFFDSNSIVPASAGTFSSQTLRQLRANTIGQLTNFQNNVRAETNENIRGLIQTVRQTEPNFNIDDPLNLLEENFSFGNQLNEPASQHLKQLSDQAKSFIATRTTNQYFRNYGISPGLVKFAEQRNISITKLSAEDLATEAIDLWGGVNVFQQNLGQLFVAYRDMMLANSLKELEKNKTGRTDISAFTTEEFAKRYGQSPWDFVNEVLARAQLPFRINAPESFAYEDFTPQLTKTTTGVKIPFESLSSGEKVLMSFALCLYQARDGRQAIEYPEILLLDEIDAPLHPSMVKDLIATIKDVLVAEKNIKVILTTHSPTTVAIAPEESVFVMRDSRTLKKTSKEAALRLLTYGVPTLSISFDARRQVFVESRKDAFIYDELYRQLKPKIKAEKSLVFIAASGAKKEVDISNENGGSSVVNKLVKQLTDAGNTSVYGLIDWDAKSATTDRVKVLAEKGRYSLDTCVLDPCLLALLVIRENIDEAKKINLVNADETYIILAQATKVRMQILVDKLAVLLGYEGEKIECHYSGGESLHLAKTLLHGNGHAFSKVVLEKFPFLRKISNNNNAETGMLNRIVKNIVPDSPAWLPIEIQQAFETLAAE
jgi:ABC-type cobalamin/Fe3+-siderophores transport system ATPase subunit